MGSYEKTSGTGIPAPDQAVLGSSAPGPAGVNCPPATLTYFIYNEQIFPYKDLETRRRYDREYKRRLRAQTGLTKPRLTRRRKANICFGFPGLRIHDLAFRDGWLITDNPEEQAIIEQDPDYGKHIFSWWLEP